MFFISGYQKVVPRTFRQTKGTEEIKPLITCKLPRLTRSVGALSRFHKTCRKSWRSQFTFHTHSPFAERVQAASSSRNFESYDGVAKETAHRDCKQVSKTSGQSTRDSAAGIAKLARTHGAWYEAHDRDWFVG